MANERTVSIPGERVLKTSDQGVLELTNYRVKYDATATGSSKHVTIPLDAVASCGLVTRSHPWLLGTAVITGIIAFAPPQATLRYLLLFVAAVLVIAYFVTRSVVITVSSSGGEPIVVPASGMNHGQIVPFLDAVLQAKLAFLGRLNSESEKVETLAPIPNAPPAPGPTADTGPKGKCPNCEAVIPLSSLSCPKCRADFSLGAAWKVTPI